MLLNNEKYQVLLQAVEKSFTDVGTVRELYGLREEKAVEKKIKDLDDIRAKAVLGDKFAREYMINNYVRLIKYFDYSLDEIERLIDFDNLYRNHVRVLFEMLIHNRDMSSVFEEYGLKDAYYEKDVEGMVELYEEEIKISFSSYDAQVDFLATLLYEEVYGGGCVDSFQFHNINEIGVLRKDYIYIVYKGNKIHLAFLELKSEGVLLNLQKKMTENASIKYDAQNPFVTTAKENSNRITVAGHSMVPDPESLYYNERVFNLDKINLEEMRDRFNTIDDDIYKFLIANQKGKGSHFVSGSDMGIGKSTFLLAMFEKIPNKWGVGILDTQNELQAHWKYPSKNVITLLENAHKTIAQCFEAMLKQARDVLYVGEITKPAEVQELINASLRLNSGVGATLHSYSPKEVVPNLRNLLMRTEMYEDAEMAETDVARALDLVVHLKKVDNGRIVVESISELEYLERDSYEENTLKLGDDFSYEEKLSATLDLAQKSLSKSLYKKTYKINTLFKFNEKEDKWEKLDSPSENYFTKLGNYLSEEEIEEVRAIFSEVS